MRRAIGWLRWRLLLWAVRQWARHEMDQFDRWKIETESGPVYVAIEMEVAFPGSYDPAP